MEATMTIELFSSLIFLFLVCYLFQLSNSKRNPKCNLPPSPPSSLPILGHLHLIKRPIPLHRTLHNLSIKYGPIISLRFGTRHVVVVSSSSLAQECFTKNDIVLANRPRFMVGKHLAYNNTTMVQAPYGDHWRNLRRIGSIEIFSNHRLNTFSTIRKDEVKRLIIKLSRRIGPSQDFGQVQLRLAFQELTFNIIMRMLTGKRYYGEDVSDEEEAREFRKMLKEVVAFNGTSNPGDYLPILSWAGSIEKKVMGLGKWFDRFFQNIIDEYRRKRREGFKNENTIIDHLLSLQESQPEYYTDEIIKGIVLVLLFAGTETSAVTLEWAMSSLLNHPSILKKAKDEIEKQLGQECLVDEVDISKLPYLQNIISETLRLHPAAPLLVPHMASDDFKLGGYDLPRDTILLVNAWTIHRDSTLWDDPMSFKPERFEKGEAEAYKIMPFGLGRRSCPGAGLAQRVIGLTMASLIQCFDWKRVSEKEIDMNEDKSGITISKAEPLVAKGKPCPITSKIMECAT